ncbi:hypothetical protein MYW52_25630 [Pseudomonas juntendi]|uniref:hypothetical protein n=1 Tax=Pseudomonas juntendi TaxID=2666183 RepID=UPI001FFC62DF|nr:hypothetical protein [Pseudomonas juntendi]MCK2118859.1 hypothetical protein [Pseudomonas juntendi]
MKYLMSFLSFMEVCEYRFDHVSGEYVCSGYRYSDFFTYFVDVYSILAVLPSDPNLDGEEGRVREKLVISKSEDEFVSQAFLIALFAMISDLQYESSAADVYLCCLARDFDPVDQILSAYFCRMAGSARVSLLH